MNSASLTKNSRFMMLSISESVSRLGDMAQGIALAAYIYTLTESAGFFGLFLLLRFLPGFLIAPLGGVIADTYSRRNVAVSVNALLAICSVLLVIWSDSIPHILVLAVLAAVINLPYRPAVSASVPAIVPDEQLPAANGLMNTFDGAARMIGAAAAALGLMTSSLEIVFWFNAVTFAISALVTWIAIPNVKNEATEPQEETDKATLWQSVQYMWNNRGLRTLVIGSTLLWGAVALSDVLLVPLLGVMMEGGEKYYGIYRFIAAVGMAFGGYVSVKWHTICTRSDQSLKYGFSIPVFIIAVGTAGLALWPLTVGYLFYFIIWTAMFMPNTLLQVELQRTPDRMRGKMVSLADAVDGALFTGLTSVLPLITIMPTQELLLVSAIPFAMYGLVLTVGWVQSLR